MDISQQKQVADKVLFDLEYVDAQAILAGGAPRDWYFGREANDLDFYFYADTKKHPLSEMVGLFRYLKFPTWIKNGYVYDNRNPHLLYVFDGKYDDMKVQFMWWDIPTSFVVDSFALDICHIWYKDEQIHTTPAFDACIQSKTLHILNPLYGKQDKYVQKIMNKFPDFSLVE